MSDKLQVKQGEDKAFRNLTGVPVFKIRKLPSGNSWEDSNAEGIMGIRYYNNGENFLQSLLANHEIGRQMFGLFINFDG